MHRRTHRLAFNRRAVDDPVRPDIQRPFSLAALVVQNGQPLPQRLLGHEQRGFLFADLERQDDDLVMCCCPAAQPARTVARAIGRYRPTGRRQWSWVRIPSGHQFVKCL